MAQVMVDTWLSAHKDQVEDRVWQKRRSEWTYDVSERGWTRLLNEIAEGQSNACVYLAVAKGNVVGLVNGFVSASSKAIAEVGSLYVRQSHQGQGLGHRLLETVATHMAKLGMTELRLTVLAQNTAARQFYEALGGRIAGERESEDYGVTQLELIYSWSPIERLMTKGKA